jgi:hypothetical protein
LATSFGRYVSKRWALVSGGALHAATAMLASAVVTAALMVIIMSRPLQSPSIQKAAAREETGQPGLAFSGVPSLLQCGIRLRVRG